MLPDGTRLACVRRGARVDVVEDRCPHEGHPLSMGIVRDGVLTCQWHNWKFDLASGGCMAGGEGVRRFDSEVHVDEVFVDLERETERDVAAYRVDLSRAIREGAIDAIVRVALRWESTAPGEPLDAIVDQVARARPRGLLDAIPAIVAARGLVTRGLLTHAEALALIGGVASQEVFGRSDRTWPPTIVGTLDDAEEVLVALIAERRGEAVGRVLGLPADVTVDEIASRWLLPFAATKLWDRGDALLRIEAAVSLARAVTPRTARVLIAAATESLSWAVAESDLPPYRATRNALLTVPRVTPVDDDRELDPETFLGREDENVRAALDALTTASPRSVLRAIAHASIERLARYDTRWSTHAGATATALDAARPLTMARAAMALRATPLQQAAWAIQAAGLLGKLAARDAQHITASDSERLLVREALLERPPDASRLIVTHAILETHEHAPALRKVLVEDPYPSLARLAANAERHVRTGKPPTEGD